MQLDRDAGRGVVLTYPTPLFRHIWPEAETVNTALARMLLRLEQETPARRAAELRYSNHGGWRSDADLLERREPEIKTLTAWIGQACDTMMQLAIDAEKEQAQGNFEAVAWANINRDGAYHVVHQHADNHWSGVYYVDAGRPDPNVPLSGILELQDPRGVASMAPIPGFEFGHKTAIEPRSGMMLMFPSWLPHFVHPYKGEGPRIAIAFNVKVNDYRVVARDSP